MNCRDFSPLIRFGSLTVCLAVAGCFMPDVVGEHDTTAKTELESYLFTVYLIGEYSDEAPPYSVISQDPAPGTLVIPVLGGVELNVSWGPLPGGNSGTNAVSVPSVSGLTEAAANDAITQAGLVAGTVTQAYSETVATGLVISQDPAAGTSVSSGSAVALTISQGPAPTIAGMPNVVGQTQAAALTAISAAGLPVPAVLQQCSAAVPAGTVIAQNPPTGTATALVSAIALSVSSGTCTGGVEVALLPVAAGTFTMGNSGVGDDASNSSAEELPAHQVTLGAYEIGKYEVTNEQFCAVLNWAYAQGHLKDATGSAYTGVNGPFGNDPYADAESLERILYLASSNIQFSNGTFTSASTYGLPGQTAYPTEHYPVVGVTWYGAVAFCNWLSQMQGLTPCYDMTVPGWTLVVAPPSSGGYRLPTEAEWERAAAWDGAKHWIYGFTGDTLTALSQANYSNGNPLGLIAEPYTSPVGWFNGVNVNPNGGLTTVNSVSPIGAYDMTGNAAEWCQDFFLDTYYSGGAMTNPTGPTSAQQYRVARGGSYSSSNPLYRSASRAGRAPAESGKGFRLARS